MVIVTVRVLTVRVIIRIVSAQSRRHDDAGQEEDPWRKKSPINSEQDSERKAVGISGYEKTRRRQE